MAKAAMKTASKPQAKKTNQSVTSISNKKDDNQSGMTRWLRLQKVFGYLHSVREIPNSFPTKLSATITVPQGKVREWETFQVVINSFDAHMLFSDYMRAIENKDTKVTVWFDVTNIKSKHFIVESGDNAGEIVDYLDCTLNNLSSMSVDGNIIYHQDEKIAISANQYYAEDKQ